MSKTSCCLLVALGLICTVTCDEMFSDVEAEDVEEIEADKCSEEYENCGVEFKTINITDSTILNETSNSQYDDILEKNVQDRLNNILSKKVKMRGYCCPGLVCKTEGYDEEPVAPGVTHFCADPDNDLNRERMFEKWKQSLEMPPNYSF